MAGLWKEDVVLVTDDAEGVISHMFSKDASISVESFSPQSLSSELACPAEGGKSDTLGIPYTRLFLH